jgi:hypothetical protein
VARIPGWVCGAVQVVENHSAAVPWYQELERACGGVAKEVQVTISLHDNAHLLAGVKTLATKFT